MKKFLEKMIMPTFIIALLVMSVGFSIYKFNDCKRVGHSTLYCILDLSK